MRRAMGSRAPFEAALYPQRRSGCFIVTRRHALRANHPTNARARSGERPARFRALVASPPGFRQVRPAAPATSARVSRARRARESLPSGFSARRALPRRATPPRGFALGVSVRRPLRRHPAGPRLRRRAHGEGPSPGPRQRPGRERLRPRGARDRRPPLPVHLPGAPRPRPRRRYRPQPPPRPLPHRRARGTTLRGPLRRRRRIPSLGLPHRSHSRPRPGRPRRLRAFRARSHRFRDGNPPFSPRRSVSRAPSSPSPVSSSRSAKTPSCGDSRCWPWEKTATPTATPTATRTRRVPSVTRRPRRRRRRRRRRRERNAGGGARGVRRASRGD